MYSMSHTHRLLTAVCGTLCLGAVALGTQGLGRHPATNRATMAQSAPTIAPITTEATSTSEPAQVSTTTPTTEPTPEITEPTTPETVPVTRPRPTPTTPRTLPPVIEPDESWATGEWAIPTYIVMCESKGQWDAHNASGASGPYQLMPEHFGGALAMNQPRSAQHAKAAYLWNGGVNTRSGLGPQNWAACL